MVCLVPAGWSQADQVAKVQCGAAVPVVTPAARPALPVLPTPTFYLPPPTAAATLWLVATRKRNCPPPRPAELASPRAAPF